MRRAVDAFPKDDGFDDAIELLATAVTSALARDALLTVLQADRQEMERRAVKAGLPEECLGEIRVQRDLRPGQRADLRTGIFEVDVILVHLPEFVAKARLADQRRELPSFALHVSDIYRDRLREMTRRERNRGALLQRAVRDDRSQTEYGQANREGEEAVATASTLLAAWVPSLQDRLDARVLLAELLAELDPLEYQVAELQMAGMMHQGDKGDMARLLRVSPARISAAITRIREMLRRRR